MRRKRWMVVAIVVIAGMMAWVVRAGIHQAAKGKRELGYREALAKYSEEFQSGLTRKQVEDLLHSRGIPFHHISTAFNGRRGTQFGDLVKIGEEGAPWFCSEAYVYIALEFSAVEEHDPGHLLARDSDVLQRVEIFRPLTGCL